MSQQGAIVFQKGVHFRQESGGRKRAACSGEDGVHLSTMNKKIFYHVSVDAGAGEGRAAPGQCCNCLRHAGSFPARGRPCAASRLRILGEMDLSGALPVACAWGPVQGNRKGRAGRPCLPVCLHGTAQCSRMAWMGRRDPRSRSPGLPGRPDAGDPAATGRLFRCVPTSGRRTAGGQGAFLRCADAATERSVRRSFFAGPEAPGKEKAGPLAGTGLARRI